MKSNDMGPKFESLGPNMQCLDPCSVSVVGFTMTLVQIDHVFLKVIFKLYFIQFYRGVL